MVVLDPSSSHTNKQVVGRQTPGPEVRCYRPADLTETENIDERSPICIYHLHVKQRRISPAVSLRLAIVERMATNDAHDE